MHLQASAGRGDGIQNYSRIHANADGGTGFVVKASKGQVNSIVFGSTSAGLKVLKVYDKATAPTEADTPVMRIPLTGTAAVSVPIGPCGLDFVNGISFRVTALLADNDTTAIGDFAAVNIGYS